MSSQNHASTSFIGGSRAPGITPESSQPLVPAPAAIKAAAKNEQDDDNDEKGGGIHVSLLPAQRQFSAPPKPTSE